MLFVFLNLNLKKFKSIFYINIKAKQNGTQLFQLKINVSILCKTFESGDLSSVVRVFAHGAMGRRIDPSWGGGPIELFLVPASAPRLV